MGSGGIYNRYPRQRYSTPNVVEEEDETSSHNASKPGQDWRIR